jgi:hypothetical protein
MCSKMKLTIPHIPREAKKTPRNKSPIVHSPKNDQIYVIFCVRASERVCYYASAVISVKRDEVKRSRAASKNALRLCARRAR